MFAFSWRDQDTVSFSPVLHGAEQLFLVVDFGLPSLGNLGNEGT